MSTIYLSDFSDLLKKVIQPIIQDQLFRENILLSRLQKNKGLRLANGTFYITAKTWEHSWVYNVAEWGTIEDGKFSTAQMYAKAKYAYGRHTFTDVALEWIEKDEWAIANLLTEATDELKNAMQREMQRQFHGFWQGVLATVNWVSTGTTITVLATWANLGTQYIYPWQKLLVGTKAQVEAGTADAVTVVSVPSDTTFVVSWAVTVADADLVVKAGVYDSTWSVYTEMEWIRSLIDNASSPVLSTMQGLARATNGFLNAPVYKPSANEVLTISRMHEYYLKARKYGKPDLILMNSDLFAKYGALLESNKRHVNTLQLQGWFTGIEFAWGSESIPVVLDYDTCPTDVQILDTSTFTIWEMAPVSFLDRDWQVLRNLWGNSANFTAIMKFYGNLIQLKPRANARLTKIVASA